MSEKVIEWDMDFNGGTDHRGTITLKANDPPIVNKDVVLHVSDRQTGNECTLWMSFAELGKLAQATKAFGDLAKVHTYR